LVDAPKMATPFASKKGVSDDGMVLS